MADLSTIRLYRLTHIENIPHILEHGITHAASGKANPNYQPIGDSSLISSRGNRIVPIRQAYLGYFTPFYFANYTPMLYVIQKGYNLVKKTAAEEIVHCVTNIQRVLDSGLDFIFTNGHAVNGLTDYFSKEDINRVEELVDFQAIKARNWKSEEDTDMKRRKESEFLLLGDLSPEFIAGFVVYNQTAQAKLLNWGVKENQVIIKKEFYF
jgi:hypothetical protein